MPRIEFLKPVLRRATVNATARWPERLEHIATLLRADAVAVVSATPSGPTALFSYRLPAPVSWSAVLGEDAFARAERGAFLTAVPAGRWTASASFAVVAPIESWNGEAVLCGLRQEVSFDAVDAMAAVAAARLLEMSALATEARIGAALLPVPFFVWWLWTWMKGVGQMDELERRIELEALAFAFPVAVILLMTLGLLDLARPLNPDDFSLRHVWAMMPALYFLGLARARRRYQ